MNRSARTRLTVVGAVIVIASCAGSGGASAGQANPSSSSEESVMAISTTFTLSSSAFSEGGTIPRRYTCDGENVSPELSWSGAPEHTAAYALIVEDPDAHGFVHWTAFDIPGGSRGTLTEGASTSDGNLRQGRNDFGGMGYGGPCPPSGVHRYTFSLYALDSQLALSGNSSGASVRSALKGHVLAEARLTASYRRGS